MQANPRLAAPSRLVAAFRVDVEATSRRHPRTVKVDAQTRESQIQILMDVVNGRSSAGQMNRQKRRRLCQKLLDGRGVFKRYVKRSSDWRFHRTTGDGDPRAAQVQIKITCTSIFKRSSSLRRPAEGITEDQTLVLDYILRHGEREQCRQNETYIYSADADVQHRMPHVTEQCCP